jgi:general secretion pathway protein B
MSSILKALKKLEAEKALQEEVTCKNISREILNQQPENRKIVLWFWAAGIVALAVIAALTAMLLRKPDRQQTVKTPPPGAITATEAHSPPPITTPPVSATTGGDTQPPSVSQEQNHRHNSPPLPPVQQQSAGNSNRVETHAARTTAAEAPRADSERKTPQVRKAEPADTSLTLSGIAWNKDSADRLAIINGQPAGIGATVGGVIVEEIMPDRVKVSNSGRTFEIFLGKPAKAN